MEPKIFERTNYTIKAVQVTDENMEEVAEWCGGFVNDLSAILLDHPESKVIELVAAFGSKPTRVLVRVGDWIVDYGLGIFRPHKTHVFEKKFKPAQDDYVTYGKILELVRDAIDVQDPNAYACEIARKIMGL
jgi:hypothetical protein